ncbi:MAG: hypothetical protein Kow00128_17190 [Deltaproteobacteria bacterium]
MTDDLPFLERSVQERLARLCRRYILIAFACLVPGLLLGAAAGILFVGLMVRTLGGAAGK